MLTRYNFGAARDPEMLHKIYNAEPVAPIIEIPRRDIVIAEINTGLSQYFQFENGHSKANNKQLTNPSTFIWTKYTVTI